MLKAKLISGDFLLGLTKENFTRLKKNMPIKINLKDIGGPDIKIHILYGEYESVILTQLQNAGLINKDTKRTDLEN